MTTTRYLVGDPVVLTNTFTVAGVATDPTTVSLAVTKPDGTTTTYTYAGATITKTSAGVYTKTLTVDQAGTWTYLWTGTGTAPDVADGTIDVWAADAVSLLDVVTLGEAKTVLGVKGDAQDAQLQIYVTGVSRLLDTKCGAVVQRTVTGELHDGGSSRIRLKHPASAFTSVTEYQGASAITLTRETPGTAPGDAYLALQHEPDPALFSGVLVRRSGGFDWCFWPSRQNIAVTYTAGRYAKTADVAGRFKQAAFIMLRNLWATTEPSVAATNEFDTPGGRFPRFAVPNAARQLLADEWRSTAALA